jgi:hypothetical protein
VDASLLETTGRSRGAARVEKKGEEGRVAGRIGEFEQRKSYSQLESKELLHRANFSD